MEALLHLMAADERGEPATPGSIGAAVKMSSGSVTGLVDRLGRAGHVVRERLSWYPHDVWVHVVAGDWARLAQELPFVGRTAERGDDLGSRVIAARLVEVAMHLAHTLERRWTPYPKWTGTSMAALPRAGAVMATLHRAVAAITWQDREAGLVEASITDPAVRALDAGDPRAGADGGGHRAGPVTPRRRGAPRPRCRSPHRRSTMVTITENADLTTLVVVFPVAPDGQDELTEYLLATAHQHSRYDGFISCSILKSEDGVRVVEHIQWRSVEHLQAMVASPEGQAHLRGRGAQGEMHRYEVVHVVEAPAA